MSVLGFRPVLFGFSTEHRFVRCSLQPAAVGEPVTVYIDMANCSDVTVICGHSAISMLQGNSAYCVKLSGEDMSRYSNKTESVGLRKRPYYHYLTKKVVSQ